MQENNLQKETNDPKIRQDEKSLLGKEAEKYLRQVANIEELPSEEKVEEAKATEQDAKEEPGTTKR